MPGHIFDTNTLRNFALVGQLELLPKVLGGTLYLSEIVEGEILRGAKRFPQNHRDQLEDPRWREYISRFQGIEARLKALKFVVQGISASLEHQPMLRFLACLEEEDRMELGEAESLALAAYRQRVLYSDELKVYEQVEHLNQGRFPCPRVGQDPPPLPVVVHSTAWILMEAVQQTVLSDQEAETIYDQMRDIWERHPRKTLRQLAMGEGLYW